MNEPQPWPSAYYGFSDQKRDDDAARQDSDRRYAELMNDLNRIHSNILEPAGGDVEDHNRPRARTTPITDIANPPSQWRPASPLNNPSRSSKEDDHIIPASSRPGRGASERQDIQAYEDRRLNRRVTLAMPTVVSSPPNRHRQAAEREGRPASPMRNPYRSSEDPYYALPAYSTYGIQRQEKTYGTTMDNAEMNPGPREREDSGFRNVRGGEKASYKSTTAQPEYRRHGDTVENDYGDNGYGYTNPRDLVQYDLNYNAGSRPLSHWDRFLGGADAADKSRDDGYGYTSPRDLNSPVPSPKARQRDVNERPRRNDLSVEEVRRDFPLPAMAFYDRQRPLARDDPYNPAENELVRRSAREDSDLTVKEVRREFPPPHNTRQTELIRRPVREDMNLTIEEVKRDFPPPDTRPYAQQHSSVRHDRYGPPLPDLEAPRNVGTTPDGEQRVKSSQLTQKIIATALSFAGLDAKKKVDSREPPPQLKHADSQSGVGIRDDERRNRNESLHDADKFYEPRGLGARNNDFKSKNERKSRRERDNFPFEERQPLDNLELRRRAPLESVSKPIRFAKSQSDSLGAFFSTTDPRKNYNDSDLQKISSLLKESGRFSWSEVPRIYVVLRSIGQLQIIDQFLDQGITDIWFPFSSATLPNILSSSLHDQFINTQTAVLTKGLDLEKDEKRKHAHFGRDEVLPFKVEDELGRGRFSQVHKVTSLISKRQYARKRFRRGNGLRNEAEIKSFKVELQILKKIDHHHCVELVGNLFSK